MAPPTRAEVISGRNPTSTLGVRSRGVNDLVDAANSSGVEPLLEEEMANGAEPDEYGSSIRFYDPQAETWKVAWHGPGNSNLRTFTASQVGDDIVLEGTTLDGRPMHWIISEITDISYHWRSVASDDEGRTWQLREEAEVRRVD